MKNSLHIHMYINIVHQTELLINNERKRKRDLLLKRQQQSTEMCCFCITQILITIPLITVESKSRRAWYRLIACNANHFEKRDVNKIRISARSPDAIYSLHDVNHEEACFDTKRTIVEMRARISRFSRANEFQLGSLNNEAHRLARNPAVILKP